MSPEPPARPSTPGPPEAARPPPPPPYTRGFPAPELGDALRSGWGSAAVAAAVVLAIVVAFNVLLAVLNNAVAPDTLELDGQVISQEDVLGSQLSAGDALQFGLISTYAWHGVGLRMEVEVPFQEGLPPVPVVVSFAFSQVLGLFVVGYLLFRAGGIVAGRARGEGWVRAIHGPKLALLYALLTGVVSLLAAFRLEIPTPPGPPPVDGLPESIAFKPSLVGAFLMPFSLALVTATLGAIGRAVWSVRGLWRLGFAAIAGAWRMTWMTVLFASVGFLIVAGLHPDETRAYFEFLGQGELDATIVATMQTLILLPNVGVAVGAASMGGSVNLAFLGGACPMISYASFPGGIRVVEPDHSSVFGDAGCGLLPIDLDLAPPGYLLFLLVPLVATIVGGILAAQRGEGLARGQAALVGLAAALPFAVFVWLLAVFARFGGSASGVPSPVPLSFWVGPGLVSTFLLALVWGAAGGALGGALAAGSPGPRASRELSG